MEIYIHGVVGNKKSSLNCPSILHTTVFKTEIEIAKTIQIRNNDL